MNDMTSGNVREMNNKECDTPSFPTPETEDGDSRSSHSLTVSNTHPSLRVNQRLLARIMRNTLKREGTMYHEVALILVDRDTMREYHKEYSGDDSPTDHLGFQYEASPGRVSGDIFVSLDDCAEQAAQLGEPGNRELARLVIHGVLHLTGWRDDTKRNREEMAAREDALLDQYSGMPAYAHWLTRGLRGSAPCC